MFQRKEIDHLNWANQLASYVIGNGSYASGIEVNAEKCTLGKWYYSDARAQLEKDYPALKSLLTALGTSHKHMHESAAIIQATLASGGAEAMQHAQAIFNNETLADLEELHKTLHTIDNILGKSVATIDTSKRSRMAHGM